MKQYKANVVAEVSNVLGEGPVWDDNTDCLYWVDILGNKIYRLDALRNQVSWIEVNVYPSTIILTKNQTMIITAIDIIAELPLFVFDESQGEVVDMYDSKIYHHSHRFLGKSEKESITRRFNDGKSDASGRLWLGTMAVEQNIGENQGGLYCLDFKQANPELKLKIGETTISNGLCWDNKRGFFYFIDTMTYEVSQYKWDEPSGEIANKKSCYLVDQSEGSPDGMTIDHEGMLWIALWGGNKVIRVNPHTGERLAEVNVGASLVTCMTFGGSDLRTMYITTAKDDKGHGGDLYSVEGDVTGVATYRAKL